MESRQSRYDLLRNPVEFVTASEYQGDSDKNAASPSTSNKLNGDEARKIYEEILNEKPNCESFPSRLLLKRRKKQPSPKSPRPKHASAPIESNPLSIKDFFKAAQNGNLSIIEKCIEIYKIDVNAKDEYSWTALMMAAHEGHEEIVLQLLLNDGKWEDIIDGSGYDARELACLGGHPGIANILTNSEYYLRQMRLEKFESEAWVNIKKEKIWCETCKTHFQVSNKRKGHEPHFCSTLHLLNRDDGKGPIGAHYYIPGTNKGYQMMTRGGWDGESGLGPGGIGYKFPVKTILKRDRLGFGAETRKLRPKVTHFAAHDKQAIKFRERVVQLKDANDVKEVSSRTKRRRQLSNREAVEKQKEIDFRRSFN